MPNDPNNQPKTYKQTLTHVLAELQATPLDNHERRDRLYELALRLEELMTMRGKVKAGRPRGGKSKNKIIAESKARQEALRRPLNAGVAIREKIEAEKKDKETL